MSDETPIRPIRITVLEVRSWGDLPPHLSAALEETFRPQRLLPAPAAPKAEEVFTEVTKNPPPAEPEPEPVEAAAAAVEPRTDAEWLISQLLEDQATHMVADVLIAPLYKAFPRTRGEASKVLRRTAAEFKDYQRLRLDFARKHLLMGKHEFFPDFTEIRAACGRFGGRTKQKPAQK